MLGHFLVKVIKNRDWMKFESCVGQDGLGFADVTNKTQHSSWIGTGRVIEWVVQRSGVISQPFSTI